MKDRYRTRAQWHVHDALRGLMKKAKKYDRYPSFEKWGLDRQLQHAEACLTYLELAMTLDHFWDSVEEDKEWYQERLKTIALEMLRTSTMRDDDDGQIYRSHGWGRRQEAEADATELNASKE